MREVLGNQRSQSQQSWLEFGDAYQPLIRKGAQFGLLTRIATESVSSCNADEKLTAFVELEVAIRP